MNDFDKQDELDIFVGITLLSEHENVLARDGKSKTIMQVYNRILVYNTYFELSANGMARYILVQYNMRSIIIDLGASYVCVNGNYFKVPYLEFKIPIAL